MSTRPSTHAAARRDRRPHHPVAAAPTLGPGPDPTTRPAPSPTTLAPVTTSASLLVAPSHELGLAAGRLEELRHQSRRTLAAAERARAPITCLGLGLVPDRPRLHPAATSDWVLTPLRNDPLHRNGRFPIPARQRRHLARLHRSDVAMDELLVAHEIPKDLAPSVLAQSVLPVPAAAGAIELDPEDLGDLIVHPGPAPSTRRFAATAGEIAGAVGRMAGTAGTVAAAVPRLAAGLLDPVVFGIQRVPGHRHAGIVYELVRWEW